MVTASCGLAGVVETFKGVVDELVVFDPVGRDGKDLLEYLVELNTQAARLVSVTATTAEAYHHSGEWVLSNTAKAAPPPKRTGKRCVRRTI
jgi:hypothetical protein